ncbi:putative outer membrane protein (plasmid) [Phaeobacter inhibens]|uniref:Outer membrane protein n=1 Tax=Phaeobacter inhibens TaxID=221822 RepID=A0ABM6RKH7_9RHOB|nr:MipA/OmpV family protein [Phaeobacter inhibens]AUQ52316.1 putative outer membrane protein [Phaeobacter inhibens]AUQ96921.1 putative outer membrane protein [Phaeobacter inhibens]AUR22122.1 putative outer membrane protein [Phaeobacter inhibens]
MSRTMLSLALALLAGTASAEGQWTVGGAGIGATGIYVGEENTASFAPVIIYDTEKFHIGLDGLSYQVFDYGLSQVDVALGYRGAPAFPDKDPLFEGLKRDDAVELGLSIQLEFGNAYVGIGALTDISDGHGGTEADFNIGYIMNVGNLQVDTALGARYRDAALNQYLFGVTGAEATAIRPAYAAKYTTTAFANVTVAYPITDTITAMGQIGCEDLGDNQDCPLVEQASSTSIGLGVIWTF